MHVDEADNFLNLSAALKVILSRSILEADVPRARYFLEKYLQTYLKVLLPLFVSRPHRILTNHPWNHIILPSPPRFRSPPIYAMLSPKS